MSEISQTDETGGSLNELFEVLSHGVRRRILMAVARENPRDDEEITSESVADEHQEADALELLKQQLYHTHLPKLEDAGFIDWDQERGLITRGPRFEEIGPLLRLMHDHQDELPDDWP